MATKEQIEAALGAYPDADSAYISWVVDAALEARPSDWDVQCELSRARISALGDALVKAKRVINSQVKLIDELKWEVARLESGPVEPGAYSDEQITRAIEAYGNESLNRDNMREALAAASVPAASGAAEGKVLVEPLSELEQECLAVFEQMKPMHVNVKELLGCIRRRFPATAPAAAKHRTPRELREAIVRCASSSRPEFEQSLNELVERLELAEAKVGRG